MAALCAALLPGLPAGEAAEWQYKAQRGDTPLDICSRFTRAPGCSLALARLNGIPPRAPVPVGTTVRIPAEWLKDVPIVGGVLESSEGAAYRPVSGTDFAPLLPGEPVYLGDTIRTAAGTAVLEFVSGLMIEVRPHSVLVLQSVVDLAEAPVVNVDLASGAAMVASTGDGPAGEPWPAALALEDGASGALSLDADAQAQLLAGAERLLEEQPTASGHRPAAARAPGGAHLADAIDSVLARLGLDRGLRNSFAPARLEWTPAAGVRTWQVELLALPRRMEMTQTFVAHQPMLSLPDLAVGCYELRIRPVDAQGRVGFAPRESWCVHPPLAVPVPRAEPVQGTNGRRVVWADIDRASGYLVEIASDAGFKNFRRSLQVDDPVVTLPLSGTPSGFLRVRALNAAGMAGPASLPVALGARTAATAARADAFPAVN